MTGDIVAGEPKLTLIIATFNAGKTLPRCLASIARQTYLNREVIVIDGGSTDDTVEILRQNNLCVSRWITEPDSGIYNAWNKGLRMASGDWIGFLGADDVLWDNNVLAFIATEVRNLPKQVRVFYGRVALLETDNRVLEILGLPWNLVRNKFLAYMSIPHTGTWCRRSLFEDHGSFDESFKIAGDYEFLLRELKSADAHFADKQILVGMRAGGTSSRSSHIIRALRENDRAQEKHGVERHHGQRAWGYIKAYLRMSASTIMGEELIDTLVNRMRKYRVLFHRIRYASHR